MVNKSNNPGHSADQKTIRVNVDFRGTGEGKTPSTRAYLFDLYGRFITSQPVEGKPLTFPVNAGQKYRVGVGRDLLKDQKAEPANLTTQLDQAKAFSQDYIPAIHGDILSVAINQQYWLCWLFPTCINVHGMVRKLLNPGSAQPVYAPICQCTVQIFQVHLASAGRCQPEAVSCSQQVIFVLALVRTDSGLGLLLAGTYRSIDSVRWFVLRRSLLLVSRGLSRSLFRGCTKHRRDPARDLRPADRVQHLLRLRRFGI